MPIRISKMFVATLSLLSLFLLSSCSINRDEQWVSKTGTVKRIQGISPENTQATEIKKPLYMTVTFQYKIKNKMYEGSQTVSINAPKHFEVGQPIDLKVNREDPYQSKIDLPPEPPDRTGMKWRRMSEYPMKRTECP